MTDHPPHLRSPVSRALATCVEPFYAAAVALRNVAFDLGLRRSRHAHVPVVSIGNITVGGTGKTPMAIAMVLMLKELGASPAVLLRGYRADPHGQSDEQDLLTLALPGTPIIAQPKRVAGARHIARFHPEADVIVLDDGFQHRALHRDVDFALVDATNPFGFGHVLPRGLLREPAGGLKRADAVIVTRADRLEHGKRLELDERIAQFHGRPPAAHAAYRWTHILDQEGLPVSAERASRVWLMAGVGNPAALIAQAAERFVLVGSTLFPDHASYDHARLKSVEHQMAAHQPDALVTTEKDWVKLQPLLQSAPLSVPVWRPQQVLTWLDGQEAIRQLLARVVKPTSR